MATSNNSSCPASTSLWDSVTSSVTSAFDRAKNSVSSVFSSNDTNSNTSSMTGGKRKRKRKHKGGKPADNISLTNTASQSAKISGIESAKPHQMTRGGKRKNKSKKSRKSRK